MKITNSFENFIQFKIYKLVFNRESNKNPMYIWSDDKCSEDSNHNEMMTNAMNALNDNRFINVTKIINAMIKSNVHYYITQIDLILVRLGH